MICSPRSFVNARESTRRPDYGRNSEGLQSSSSRPELLAPVPSHIIILNKAEDPIYFWIFHIDKGRDSVDSWTKKKTVVKCRIGTHSTHGILII